MWCVCVCVHRTVNGVEWLLWILVDSWCGDNNTSSHYPVSTPIKRICLVPSSHPMICYALRVYVSSPWIDFVLHNNEMVCVFVNILLTMNYKYHVKRFISITPVIHYIVRASTRTLIAAIHLAPTRPRSIAFAHSFHSIAKILAQTHTHTQ